MRETKETSPSAVHSILSEDFVSFHSWWTAAKLTLGLVPAEMFRSVDRLGSASWWRLGTVVFVGWDVRAGKALRAKTNDN